MTDTVTVIWQNCYLAHLIANGWLYWPVPHIAISFYEM